MSSNHPNPCLTWENDRYVVALISLRGERHRRQGAPNQDASYGCCGHVRGLPYIALGLADGHGGKDYPRSELGAQLAVTAFGEMAGEFAHYVAELSQANQDWRREASRHFATKCGQRLVQIWQAKVDAHCTQGYPSPARGDMARRSYGTTIAGIVLIDDLLFAGAIGDSRIYQIQLVDLETRFQPLTEHPQGLGLSTPSLVSPTAHLQWQGTAAAQEETAALILCTDGFSDSFADQGEAIAIDLFEKTRRNGLRWLRDRLPRAAEVWNREGVADDLSLILCIRSDLMIETKPESVSVSIPLTPPKPIAPAESSHPEIQPLSAATISMAAGVDMAPPESANPRDGTTERQTQGG